MSAPLAAGTGRFPAMARRNVLALLALGGHLGALARPANGAPSADTRDEEAARFRDIAKALWIWRTPLAELSGVAHFMRAWGFDTALLSVPPHERQRTTDDGSAFAPLGDQGVRTLVAAGDPNWVRRAMDAPLPRPLLTVLDLASQAGAAGLALDVEPHALPAWKGPERAALASGFVALLAALREETWRRRLALWVAVHPAHARTPDPTQPDRSLFDATLVYADHIVTMAYRASAADALAFAGPLLASLQRRPVPWHFGVSTETGETVSRISYGGVSGGEFCRAMVKLDEALRRTGAGGSYRGIAVHHFRPTAALLS